MKMSIQAIELTVTPEEMRDKLTPETIERIKDKGVLQAYRLAHEGKSRPRVIGEGKKTLHWSRAVIKRLADLVKTGTKFFIRHGDTNAHEGRKSVGEVVASYVKEIGDKVSDVVIGHFPDSTAVRDMDVCSVEADVHIDDDIVGDINGVSGIALGQSDRDKPAFAGASRLAVLQCFDDDINATEGGKKMSIVFSDAKDFVRDHNVFPSQMYSESDIRNDRQFGPIYDTANNLKKENERLRESNKKLVDEKESLARGAKLLDAKERFHKSLSNDLTDRQKQFIMSRFNAETVADMDDDALKMHIDNERKNYAATAKIFGVAGELSTDTVLSNNGTENDEESSVVEAALKKIGAI